MPQGFCLEFGPHGRNCATACNEEAPCPGGYECAEVDHGRAVLFACVPAGGAPCPCLADFVEQGYLTVCYVENEHGKCEAENDCEKECPAQVPAPEECNDVDDDCDGYTDEDLGPIICLKTNEFGTCPGQSICVDGSFDNCDAPEAANEECNGADDDCDGDTDEDIEPITCEETNEWGTCVGLVECVGGGFDDCLVKTPTPEECDEEDNDCDGVTDEEGAVGCLSFYYDWDDDEYGKDPPDIRCLCGPKGDYTASQNADCDDTNPLVHLGAYEVCNGVDDNCDGETDEEDASGCTDYYFDNDGDGYSLTGVKKCLCEPFGKFTAEEVGDCNDTNTSVHPGAEEKCNGIDDDCDGDTDEPPAECG